MPNFVNEATEFLIAGDFDPTGETLDFPQGTIFVWTGSSGGTTWQKQDDGPSSNWTEFANGTGGITQLTGDVTAGPGTGSQAATVVLVGGATAADVATATALSLAATSANAASAIVRRDASGNFRASSPLDSADVATKGYVDGVATGANTTLSNLTSPTAINQSLIFGLGTAGLIATKDGVGVAAQDITISPGTANLTNAAGDINLIAQYNVGSSDPQGNINIISQSGVSSSNITINAGAGGFRFTYSNGAVITGSGVTFSRNLFTGPQTSGAFIQLLGGTSGGANGSRLLLVAASSGASTTDGGGITLGGNGSVLLKGGISGGVDYTLIYPGAAPSVNIGRTSYVSGSGSILVNDISDQSEWKYLPAVLFFDSAASTGGSSSEVMTVTGLLASTGTSTDDIIAVTQVTPGGNNVAITGWSAQADNSLTIQWTANPGAGAIVRVAVKREKVSV